MSNHTCVHCGCVLETGEAYHFNDEFYCEDCFDELTTTCDCCGKRIFKEENEGNNTSPSVTAATPIFTLPVTVAAG